MSKLRSWGLRTGGLFSMVVVAGMVGIETPPRWPDRRRLSEFSSCRLAPSVTGATSIQDRDNERLILERRREAFIGDKRFQVTDPGF